MIKMTAKQKKNMGLIVLILNFLALSGIWNISTLFQGFLGDFSVWILPLLTGYVAWLIYNNDF